MSIDSMYRGTVPAHRKRRAMRSLTLALILLGFGSQVFGEDQPARPRLVLQITVDQLRGDLLARYAEHFGSGGFRYLLDEGSVYEDAHHTHANTETIVGHTTLATGAHPSAHGMVGNVWFDRETGHKTYNIEDPDYNLLTAGADVDDATEIDPTQRAATVAGRSPRSILVSTFSDELVANSAGRALAFGVSVKDRGAVSMAGHAGKAFWFSKASGEFVTSSYYYDRYPAWVEAHNAKRPTARYAGKAWELLHDLSTYLFGAADDVPWETDFPGYGRTFPHAFGDGTSKYFTTLLTVSPAGDEMTLAFAKDLIENEPLGRDAVPDFLGVSFSSTDYVGHLFSPSSLESEDNLLHLDRTLAELFRTVDEKVGLEHTLIVLSADHGAPEAPGYLEQFGIKAGYVDPSAWNQQPGLAALREKFGLAEELILSFIHPYVYLDQAAIRAQGLDPDVVEHAVAEELAKLPGVAAAVASSDVRTGRVPDTRIHRSILHNFNPSRSGDVFIVFEPQHFINDFDGLTVASTHGSPWTYDTFVPLIFAGAGVPAQRIHRRVHTVDVAPTLAAFVDVKSPSGAIGRPLVEVLRNR